MIYGYVIIWFVKQKTANEMRISDRSSDVCSSDLKTVTEADIVTFADLTGNTNPVHMDEAFAAATPYKGRIAHGMLGASLISTVFGTRLPGPGCISVSQDLDR